MDKMTNMLNKAKCFSITPIIFGQDRFCWVGREIKSKNLFWKQQTKDGLNKLKAIVNDTNVYSEVAVTTYSGSSKQHSTQQFYWLIDWLIYCD
jgi:hypothetical protein